MTYIIGKFGYYFSLKTKQQADNLTAKLKEMTKKQVAKLHRQIYG